MPRRPDPTAPSSRWRLAERQRLLSLAARIGRRRQWWAAQRDAASVRDPREQATWLILDGLRRAGLEPELRAAERAALAPGNTGRDR